MTWAAISLFLANAWGFAYAHRVLLIYAGILLFAAIGVASLFGYCRSQPKLDEVQIQKANEAIKTGNDNALREVIVESTVRVQGIDANLKAVDANANKAIEDIKKSVDAMDRDALQAEIERLRDAN